MDDNMGYIVAFLGAYLPSSDSIDINYIHALPITIQTFR